MTLYDAEIVSIWSGSGTANDPYQPLSAGAVQSWHDTTGQQTVIPPVNSVVLQVRCDDGQLAALELDPDVLIVWQEEVLA